MSHTNNSPQSHDLAVTVERRGPLLLMGLNRPAEVGPLVREGRLDLSEPGRRDPWRKDGRAWTTPVVAAVQGSVTTLAILASDAVGR